MNIEAFCDFIIKNEIIGIFAEPITLKSGRQSHFYINWRKASNDAFLLDQLSDYVAEHIKAQDSKIDSIYGVPEGATKLALLTGMKLAKASSVWAAGQHVLPMGRAKPKLHGSPEDKYFIGKPAGRVLVLEDTITTGLSLFEQIDLLIEHGVDVVGVCTLTDRMQKRDDDLSVAACINQRYNGTLTYTSLSAADEILARLIASKKFDAAVIQTIKAEFKQYGIRPFPI
jgi:orotate phosphoribosyltransferase